MAVVSVDPIWNSQGGGDSLDSDGKKITEKAEIMYRVVVDSGLDGRAIVLAADDLPKIGEGYAVGNDTGAGMICKSRTPSRESGSRFRWLVLCRFDNQSPDSQEDEENRDTDGNKVEDPEDAFKVIEIDKVTEKEVIDRAVYNGLNDVNLSSIAGKTIPGLLPGEITTPVNSACVPRRMERDRVLQLYRITQNLSVWEGQLNAYQQTVNDGPVNLSNVDSFGAKFSEDFPAHTLKILAVRPRERRIVKVSEAGLVQSLLYYRVTLEVLHDPRTHFRYELDSGRVVRMADGDPDGFGGTFASNDVPSGALPLRVPVDRFGMSLKDDVLLDGTGKMLDPQNPKNAVFVQWGVDDLVDFVGTGFFDAVTPP